MGSRCGICGRKQLEERRKAKEEKSKKQITDFFNMNNKTPSLFKLKKHNTQIKKLHTIKNTKTNKKNKKNKKGSD